MTTGGTGAAGGLCLKNGKVRMEHLAIPGLGSPCGLLTNVIALGWHAPRSLVMCKDVGLTCWRCGRACSDWRVAFSRMRR